MLCLPHTQSPLQETTENKGAYAAEDEEEEEAEEFETSAEQGSRGRMSGSCERYKSTSACAAKVAWTGTTGLGEGGVGVTVAVVADSAVVAVGAVAVVAVVVSVAVVVVLANRLSSARRKILAVRLAAAPVMWQQSLMCARTLGIL